jgi:hypothetical protein
MRETAARYARAAPTDADASSSGGGGGATGARRVRANIDIVASCSLRWRAAALWISRTESSSCITAVALRSNAPVSSSPSDATAFGPSPSTLHRSQSTRTLSAASTATASAAVLLTGRALRRGLIDAARLRTWVEKRERSESSSALSSFNWHASVTSSSTQFAAPSDDDVSSSSRSPPSPLNTRGRKSSITIKWCAATACALSPIERLKARSASLHADVIAAHEVDASIDDEITSMRFSMIHEG